MTWMPILHFIPLQSSKMQHAHKRKHSVSWFHLLWTSFKSLNHSKCSNKRHRIHSAQWPWVISIQRNWKQTGRNWKQTGTLCANWRDYREKQQFRERFETKMHPRHMSLVLIGFVRIGKSSVQVPPFKPIHSFCLFCQQQREKMRGKQGKHIYIMH